MALCACVCVHVCARARMCVRVCVHMCVSVCAWLGVRVSEFVHVLLVPTCVCARGHSDSVTIHGQAHISQACGAHDVQDTG